jgi:glutamate-5-semialdehyde dehydrogenase
MDHIKALAAKAKQASYALAALGENEKNKILLAIAAALRDNTAAILQANRQDIEAAQKKGMPEAMQDRLLLNEKRIDDMAAGLGNVALLRDPIGETLSAWKRPNGLMIAKKRVPLGVVGIIYEARPNVTADAIGLCIKTGNAVVLRGGSEAIHSNIAVADTAKKAAVQAGMPDGAIALVEDVSRDAAAYMMTLNGLIDVLIPRGGAGLIQTVVKTATIPVIETGVGNCHVYIDESADIGMGVNIIFNAKTSRPSVCNAAETLLVHKNIAEAFIPSAFAKLKEKNVELRGCERVRAIAADIKAATEEDYYKEFLDYILAVKIVDSLDDAIAHINHYGTQHSEAIVTNDYANAKRFEELVDAAAVYVNASTRFTDGNEFGFGAEIGISTQKLHARGPMGLAELTTIKYIIEGNGQIR